MAYNSTNDSFMENSTTRQAMFHKGNVSLAYQINNTSSIYIGCTYMILFVTGFVGNILSLLVYNRQSMRDSVTSFLFKSLAVFDLISCVFAILPVGMGAILNIDTPTITYGLCKINFFMIFPAGELSSLFMTMISVERCIGVNFPIKAKQIFTMIRVKVVSVSIVLLLFLVHIPTLIDTKHFVDPESGEFICKVFSWFGVAILPWMDFTLFLAIPFVVMVISNAGIIIGLTRAHAWRAQASGGAHSSTTRDTTFMLLCVSFAFLVFTLPFHIYMLYNILVLSDGENNNIDFFSFEFQFTQLLLCTNHAVNFFLYCVSGKRFRSEVKNMMLCRK